MLLLSISFSSDLFFSRNDQSWLTYESSLAFLRKQKAIESKNFLKSCSSNLQCTLRFVAVNADLSSLLLLIPICTFGISSSVGHCTSISVVGEKVA